MGGAVTYAGWTEQTHWSHQDGLPQRLRSLPPQLPVDVQPDQDDYRASRLNRRVLDRSTGQLPTRSAIIEHYGGDATAADRLDAEMAYVEREAEPEPQVDQGPAEPRNTEPSVAAADGRVNVNVARQDG